MSARVPRTRLGVTVALLTVAAVAALAPLPPRFVERVFSGEIYPRVQRKLTLLSNLSPVALLDIAALALAGALVFSFARAARRTGARNAARQILIRTLQWVAAIYLAFLLLWGFNYRRVPLEEKLPFDRTLVTRERALALASEAVARLNMLYAPAHATTFERANLVPPFADAERALGRAARIIPGIPKRSALALYFRAAAIDGMTNPLFLEVILNPDLLPFELPDVLAHEWGHLAGYADESEASFVAWLTCQRGDPLAKYSGWLSAYRRTVNGLPRPLQAQLPRLDPGPQADLHAIAVRLGRASPALSGAARGVYDSYLKAHRIQEGIENYDAVIQLILGTPLGMHRH